MAAGQFKYVRWFSELGVDDVALVGGKNASLGEMYRELTAHGVRVPNGFAITAQAYKYVLDEADAWPRLHQALDGLNERDVQDLARRAQLAREIIYGAALPPDLVAEVKAAYAQLRGEYGDTLTLAVRSSATAEDLPTASFAGQHETFLNVSGDAKLLDAVRLCFASLFKDRAISYRIDNGFDHFKVYLSVGIMKMVRADLASSGVTFSLDTETGFRDAVFITGAYGLGENVVQGTVDPDEFYVFKPTFAQGHRTVLKRKMGGKEIRMVYAKAAGRETTRNVPTAKEDQQRYCVDDEDVLALADAAIKIEEHYSRRAGHPVPMDVEWAKDGLDQKLYIVQARPETVASRRAPNMVDEYALGSHGKALVNGRAVGGKVTSGPVRVIADISQLHEFKPGDVLVADTTMPDWGTVMKIAAAVVTNRGGRTCHAAIVARELGIPAVVGCDNATTALRTGDVVTVSCAEG
ncbi:MAG: phosphoenolpyruvate synthase, partial [Pseudomonadota bacterium]